MADGVRITQAGSSQQRITQAGDRRITERAVMAGVILSAASGVAVQVGRSRYVSAALSTVPGIASAITRHRSAAVALSSGTQITGSAAGKLVASTALSATTHLASAVNAIRPSITALQTETAFFSAVGRDRTLCACLHATSDVQTAAGRERPVFADFTTSDAVQVSVIKSSKAGVALQLDTAMGTSVDILRYASVDLATATSFDEVFTTKVSPVSVHLATSATATFGRNDPVIKRITEAGEIRHTQAGNIRIVEESQSWGNIIVVTPAYRIYAKQFGVWHVLDPHVKHTGHWQIPTNIHIRDGGAWRPVRSTI